MLTRGKVRGAEYITGPDGRRIAGVTANGLDWSISTEAIDKRSQGKYGRMLNITVRVPRKPEYQYAGEASNQDYHGPDKVETYHNLVRARFNTTPPPKVSYGSYGATEDVSVAFFVPAARPKEIVSAEEAARVVERGLVTKDIPMQLDALRQLVAPIREVAYEDPVARVIAHVIAAVEARLAACVAAAAREQRRATIASLAAYLVTEARAAARAATRYDARMAALNAELAAEGATQAARIANEAIKEGVTGPDGSPYPMIIVEKAASFMGRFLEPGPTGLFGRSPRGSVRLEEV